jgi:hypothetical protein
MAARKQAGGSGQPKMVRKTVTLEEAKLEQARRLLHATSDAEVLRVALDHLLSHAPEFHGEEE